MDFVSEKIEESSGNESKDDAVKFKKSLSPSPLKYHVSENCYCEIFTMDTFGYLRQILISSSNSSNNESFNSQSMMCSEKPNPYRTPPNNIESKTDMSGPPIEWGKLFEGITETIAISPNKNYVFIM